MAEEQHAGTEGFIADTYPNPEGSVMCSGFFELHHTDAPLRYIDDAAILAHEPVEAGAVAEGEPPVY